MLQISVLGSPTGLGQVFNIFPDGGRREAPPGDLTQTFIEYQEMVNYAAAALELADRIPIEAVFVAGTSTVPIAGTLGPDTFKVAIDVAKKAKQVFPGVNLGLDFYTKFNSAALDRSTVDTIASIVSLGTSSHVARFRKVGDLAMGRQGVDYVLGDEIVFTNNPKEGIFRATKILRDAAFDTKLNKSFFFPSVLARRQITANSSQSFSGSRLATFRRAIATDRAALPSPQIDPPVGVLSPPTKLSTGAKIAVGVGVAGVVGTVAFLLVRR